MTRWVHPLSARVLSHDQAAQSRDRTRDRAARVLLRINCPPPPGWPVYGGGSPWAPPLCHCPGAISMKEDWVQGAPPHSHTQSSYAGTRDNTRRRVYMPTTIVLDRGLLSPMPLFLVAFYCRGGKG